MKKTILASAYAFAVMIAAGMGLGLNPQAIVLFGSCSPSPDIDVLACHGASPVLIYFAFIWIPVVLAGMALVIDRVKRTQKLIPA